MQGELKKHIDKQYESDEEIITCYVRTDASAEVTGVQGGEIIETRQTRTLIPYSYSDRNYNDSLSYLEGHQVLLGFKDGVDNVAFASGILCGFRAHSKSECDLEYIPGDITFVTAAKIIDLEEEN